MLKSEGGHEIQAQDKAVLKHAQSKRRRGIECIRPARSVWTARDLSPLQGYPVSYDGRTVWGSLHEFSPEVAFRLHFFRSAGEPPALLLRFAAAYFQELIFINNLHAQFLRLGERGTGFDTRQFLSKKGSTPLSTLQTQPLTLQTRSLTSIST
jgi:hypothetical protein